nr:hypothetical protein [Tanacetum cinerariifolium]
CIDFEVGIKRTIRFKCSDPSTNKTRQSKMTQTKALATAVEELPLIKNYAFWFLYIFSYRYVIKLGTSRYKSRRGLEPRERNAEAQVSEGAAINKNTKLAKDSIVALFFDKTSVVVANRNTIRTLRNSSAARIQITRDVEADPHSTNSQGILLCEKTKLAKDSIVALFFDKTSVVVANRNTIRTLRNSSAARIQITRDVEADPHSTNSQGCKDPFRENCYELDNEDEFQPMIIKVHEPVSGETSSGNTVTDSATSKKRKRNQRAKKTAAGDTLNAKVNEVVGGKMVMGKTVTDDTTPKKKKRKTNKKKEESGG